MLKHENMHNNLKDSQSSRGKIGRGQKLPKSGDWTTGIASSVNLDCVSLNAILRLIWVPAWKGAGSKQRETLGNVQKTTIHQLE
jgi:hypothetical protein